MKRKIYQLSYAKELTERPRAIPKAKRRPKGPKGRGLAFEAKVAKELSALWPQAKHSVWFEFLDRAGRGYAEVDHLVELPDCVLLFETKLSQCLAGIIELQELYQPLVTHCYNKPTHKVLVCRNLLVDPKDRLLDSPLEVLQKPFGNPVWTWHFIG